MLVFAGILFLSIIIVLLLMIFYVGPGLATTQVGPTGPSFDVEQLLQTGDFFDGSTAVATGVAINCLRNGKQVSVTVPMITFTDSASTRTGEIVTATSLPLSFRPNQLVNTMVTNTSTGTRKIGMAQVAPNGELAIFVDATVPDLQTGATWVAGTNITGNFNLSFALP